MGKEWLYWVGGGGAAGCRGGKSSGRRGRIAGEMKEAATSSGCMCAVFQLFDLHHFQPSNLQADNLCPEEKVTTSKGVEAPRNSLELEERTAINGTSKSLAIKEEENLNFPVGIQIKTSLIHKNISSSPRVSTSGSKSRSDDICSINSPGTKTPNLVARLMGLDLLPECSSPSVSSSTRIKSHLNRRKDTNRRFFDDDIAVGGTRSLPETPRISSARRSDVEYQTHRISLQMNKENINEQKRRLIQVQQDDNRSPGHYAKQIVKQVKESVTRRVGLDITNREHVRRDENLLLQKPTNKSSKIMSRYDGENSTSSRSPRIRLLDPKSPRVSSGFDKPLKEQKQKESKKVGKSSKKLPTKASDYAIRKKKEEPFVRTNKVSLRDKKSKRTPLSCDILNISGPTLLQVKKDPSPPPTKLPQKQSQVSDALSSKSSTQLSSTHSHPYKHPDKIFTLPLNVQPDNTNGCATALPGGATAEYGNYIQKILKSAGIINKLTPLPLTLTKWHSPSHAIDPSILYQLEFFHPNTTSAVAGFAGNSILNHRCNRKLIFELVDELLAEILRSHFDSKLWISPIPLVEELCKQIDGFPASKCLVLEDIDLLIDRDLCKSNFFEEERERIVCEIEDTMVEWLVGETVAEMGGRTAEKETETDRCHVRRVSRDAMPLVG